MRVIVDTCVVLDVLLDRKPFAGAATRVFNLAERSEIEAFLCATTITTVDYLLTQSLPHKKAREAILMLLEVFEIAVVNRPVLEEALRSRLTDFKDAVLAQSGCLAGADSIITRNTKDFRHSPLKVLEPVEFLSQMST